METTGRILAGVATSIINRSVNAETNNWLQEKAVLIKQEKSSTQLNLSFAAVPRKTGRHLVELTEEEQSKIKEIHPLFTINDWTIDRVCRVWLLLQIDSSEKENYVKKVENLFKAAEMNELVALYSALPVLEYAAEWSKQCAEGVRSNIGIVLEAIMYNNPYPYQYLNEQAWNQLVLKAFFTDKDVTRIIGLYERANSDLTSILIDYANERRAAHRTINPQLWRLVTKFIDAANFSNIEKAFNTTDRTEKKAVALACYFSSYAAAQQLVKEDLNLNLAILENQLNWSSL